MQRASRHRTACDEMKYLLILLLLALLIGRPGSAAAGDSRAASASELTLEGKTIYARQCSRCHGFNMNTKGNIRRVIEGEKIGSLVY